MKTEIVSQIVRHKILVIVTVAVAGSFALANALKTEVNPVTGLEAETYPEGTVIEAREVKRVPPDDNFIRHFYLPACAELNANFVKTGEYGAIKIRNPFLPPDSEEVPGAPVGAIGFIRKEEVPAKVRLSVRDQDLPYLNDDGFQVLFSFKYAPNEPLQFWTCSTEGLKKIGQGSKPVLSKDQKEKAYDILN